MNEQELRELSEAIADIRQRFQSAADLQARLDALEERLGAAPEGENARSLRAELDELSAAAEQRDESIQELRRQARQQATLADPVRGRREGLRVLGMMVREAICRHVGQEVPSAFRGEADELRTIREQRATLEAGATGGSYLVPTITATEIMDTLEEVSSLLSLVDFLPGLPGKMRLPTLTGRPTLQHARASVDTDMSQSDPAIGFVDVDPDEGYVFFPIDNRLIQMAPQQLGAWAQNLIREAIVEGVCTDLLLADGSSSFNGITGALQVSTAAFLYVLAAGNTTFSKMAKSDLTGIKAKALKRGRTRGVWTMSYEVFGLAEDMNRTGKVPVITYAQDGTPRILQNPVEIDEGMPDLSEESQAGKAFLTFGDWKTWLVGMVGGIMLGVSEHYLFGRNQTAFRGVINFDIVRKPVATFITGKTAEE